MENKIISINISPGTDEEINENAGVMWEHNATTLVFNIDSAYVGDYRYYIEYQSLIGTKVRTEYLELNTETNTVTYDIPVTMTSLRGVECYFNIVNIDEDGQTVQVIKPKKFCLEFDYSPDTDNSIAKVNDFSINALLEAIRSGAFKGEKGDSGEVANVDSKMSSTSTNPVQNKVVKACIDDIANQAVKLMDNKDQAATNAITKYIDENFVKREDGKGLSSNDFTDECKEKLDNATTGADGKDYDYIESYVRTEADNLIDKIIESQGNRTFTFACITDMHYGMNSYTDGIKHASQALKYIDGRVKLDAFAVLGDYSHKGSLETEYEDAVQDFMSVNGLFNPLRMTPNLRVQGNHDFDTAQSPRIYRYIQGYSDNVVWGSQSGGYLYRDFENHKVRVICLNTTEQSNTGLDCSYEQYQWFINSLDLTDKEDNAEWQILILSHIPIDWFETDKPQLFYQIIDAYQKGTSWSYESLSCDYANRNSAKLIANIHGHIHNLLIRKIAAGYPHSTTETVDLYRVSTPNACDTPENSKNEMWDNNPYGEDISYPKTQNTAQDTAFCVYCIDLDTYTLKAFCYGAGYDRELVYHTTDTPDTTTYTNVLPMAESGDSTEVYNSVGYKADTRYSKSSQAEQERTGTYLSGYIERPYPATIYLKNVNISKDDSNTMVYWFDEKGTAKADYNATLLTDTCNAVWDDNGMLVSFECVIDCKYIRIQCSGFDETSIVTVNETIG